VKQAVVAVIRRGEAVLAIERAPDIVAGGYWSLPSGRIEPGESQADAVVREVAEELGLGVRACEKVWECPTDDGRYTLHWWTVIEMVADAPLRPDPTEVSEARWVSADEFLALTPIFEGDREFFVRVLPSLSR
jgi:8-oxo-dGTP diphosphatase